MRKRDKKDEMKASKTHHARGRDTMNRRKRIAMRKARKRVADRNMKRTPEDIQEYIVTLRRADGTIIVKDTYANIKDWLYDLPNGIYHYVNDKTASTHFFSVHDRGVDFIATRLDDPNMNPYFGGAV